MRLCFDLETNGLLRNVSTIHTVHMMDVDTMERATFRKHGHVKGVTFAGEEYEYEPIDEIPEALELLQAADMLINHNLIGYDIPVLKKLYPEVQLKAKLCDTIVMTRLIMPDTSTLDARLATKGFPNRLRGSQSLEAWGHRLSLTTGQNFQKGDYSAKCKELKIDPWAQWNPDMEAYGDVDVDVTVALFHQCQADLRAIASKLYKDEAAFDKIMASCDFEHDMAELAEKIRSNGFPFTTRRRSR